jgi:hypothetical protein
MNTRHLLRCGLVPLGWLLASCAVVTAAPAGAAYPPPLQAVVDRARALASEEAGAASAQLRVVAAEAVTWPDGSMGCPQPGLMYTQALVPGYRVVLALGQRQWLFHANARGSLVRCTPERATPHLPETGQR